MTCSVRQTGQSRIVTCSVRLVTRLLRQDSGDPVGQAAVGAGPDLAVGHRGDVDVGHVGALGLGDVELGDRGDADDAELLPLLPGLRVDDVDLAGAGPVDPDGRLAGLGVAAELALPRRAVITITGGMSSTCCPVSAASCSRRPWICMRASIWLLNDQRGSRLTAIRSSQVCSRPEETTSSTAAVRSASSRSAGPCGSPRCSGSGGRIVGGGSGSRGSARLAAARAWRQLEAVRRRQPESVGGGSSSSPDSAFPSVSNWPPAEAGAPCGLRRRPEVTPARLDVAVAELMSYRCAGTPPAAPCCATRPPLRRSVRCNCPGSTGFRSRRRAATRSEIPCCRRPRQL